MITLRSDELKNVCNKILSAVDTNNLSPITETLEVVVVDNVVTLSVTNEDYIVRTKIKTFGNEDFKVSVNANLFLKLMAKITTETIKMDVNENTLEIVANGKYRIPTVVDSEGNMVSLPDILLDDIHTTMDINTRVLHSITSENSKELAKKDFIVNPVQNMYYVDEKGCITFSSGACVNNFTLKEPIRFLLNGKIVKLFKLFTSDNVTMTFSTSGGETYPSKVKFSSEGVELTTRLVTSMLNDVPVDAIRGMTDGYSSSTTIARTPLLDSVNRLILFSTNESIRPFGKVEITKDKITISDRRVENVESFEVPSNVDGESYSFTIDLTDLKLALEASRDEDVTILFGNSKAIVIKKENISNVIPECM